MSLVEHAKRELALLNNDDAFNDSLIKAVEGFVTYGHSGSSASVGIGMLNALLNFKNLTPLTDNPDEWMTVGPESWQNCRNPEAFSNDGGKHHYFLSEGASFENPSPLHESAHRINRRDRP